MSLSKLLYLRQIYPGNQSKLVFGNTRVQMEKSYKKQYFPRLIAVTHIEELQQLKRTATTLTFGTGITFTRLQAKLLEWQNDNNADNKVIQALLHQMTYFASTHARSVASLGGNIVSASPM